MKNTDINIHFGTDGWRAKIADDFTFDNVKNVIQAIADYLKRDTRYEIRDTVIIGYDRRFMSQEYAKLTSTVLAGNGIKVLLTEKPTPTPAITFAIKKKRLKGGIIITASHNPPLFNGIKFKTEQAAPADEHITGKIEQLIGKNRHRQTSFEEGIKSKDIEYIDADKDYIDFLRRYVDVKRIKKSSPKVLIDYMHGVGTGYIEKILGGNIPNIEAIRTDIDPLFGGVNPEPIPKNMAMPLKYIKTKKFDLGVAIDGDGDRIGAMRPDGRYVTSGQIISLILLHLIQDKGLCGTVVKTISGTTLIEHICDRYNLKLLETPIGFKNIASLMLKQDILIGGEESGGIGFCRYMAERDGLLSALLLIEMIAERKKNIIAIMNEIDKEYGRFCYDRLDVEYPFSKAGALTKSLKDNPPSKIDGRKIVKIKTYDGIKFIMEDSSWLLLRFSGTEPLLRIYAESRSDAGVRKLLEAGKRLIR